MTPGLADVRGEAPAGPGYTPGPAGPVSPRPGPRPPQPPRPSYDGHLPPVADYESPFAYYAPSDHCLMCAPRRSGW
jgi:hypothetical protein